jgi:aspartate aminotransferase/N-succinyldiaminopimelate aminotransferase
MTSTLNPALDEIPFSAFEDLERRISRSGHTDVLRLHQGKTTYPPCVRGIPGPPGFPMSPHEHAPPGGIPALQRRIAEHLCAGGRDVTADDLVITGGSTQAISTVLHAVLLPGDEVLVLSPQWLFAVGLIAAAGGRPVEVPVFLELDRDPAFDVVAALERHCGPRTRALYFNSPNNPTGHSLSPEALAGIARFAARRGLWIIADNAYENYDDSPHGFIEIASLRDAAARTFSVHSFSKTYAMPGYRVGWIVAPPGLAPRLRKWSLYSIYSLSTTSQAAAFDALSTEPAELTRRREGARAARELVDARLEIPATRGSGGLYCFLDLAAWRDGDVDGFLDACVAERVTVAPGLAFGRHCARYARLCYTAVRPEDLPVAVDRLNRVYGRR